MPLKSCNSCPLWILATLTRQSNSIQCVFWVECPHCHQVPAAYSTLVNSTVWQILGMILRMPPHSFYEIASIYRNLAPLIQAIEL